MGNTGLHKYKKSITKECKEAAATYVMIIIYFIMLLFIGEFF